MSEENEQVVDENVAGSFFSKQTEEDKSRLNKAFNKSSTVEQGKKIEVPGSFLMEVTSRCYKDKDGKINAQPNLSISSQTKSLMLYISLEVVDDAAAPLVNKGDYLGVQIVLSPMSGAPAEKYENIFKFSKPKIAALVGEKNVATLEEFNQEFVNNFLVSLFKEKEDGSYVETKKHKMTRRVYVVAEEDYYNNKMKIKVKSIIPATDKMHSKVSSQPIEVKNVVDTSTPDFGSPASPASGGNKSIDDAAASLTDDNAPPVEEDDTYTL